MINRLTDEQVDGQPAALVDIASPAGFTARLSAYGARLVGLTFPDGFEAVAGPRAARDFTGISAYCGPICGRVANRISNARFSLAGVTHQLEANLGAHHLHGGRDGFNHRIWHMETGDNFAKFAMHSPDGDQGYPGALTVSATYSLDGATLRCALKAETTKATPVNLTNHVYWNLSGGATVAGHSLQVEANRYCVADDVAMVTGEVRDVAGSPLDFRTLRGLSQALPPGIDHNFCLEGRRGTLRHAGTLAAAGRRIDIATSECGLQIYTANHAGFSSVAMEPQAWPDAPNQPAFPSIVLRPGETYSHVMEWRFG